MTFAHPSDAARPVNARIRILGCDPPPPKHRGPNWPLLGACVAVAVAGVGITLAVRGGHPQNAQPAVTQAAIPATMEVMGNADLGARRPDPRAFRPLSAISADFASAARVAARQATTAVPVSPAKPWRAGPTQTPAPVASTPLRATSAPATTVVGPELPPNASNPDSPLDPQ